jgi:dihydropteroate synthase
LELIKNLKKWKGNYPCLAGTSRKGFIGKVLDQEDPKDRLIGSLTTIAHCVAQGANIIRVHDVKESIQVVKMTNRIYPLEESSTLL